MRSRLHAARSRWTRARTTRLLDLLESPARFRRALRVARLVGPLAGMVPGTLGSMLGLLPARVPAASALPAKIAASGARRGRVALMTGCVQQVLRPAITDATARVLAANGVEVSVPVRQGCCGALAAHVGEEPRSRRLAEAHQRAFPADVDAIVVTAAGCGSWMKQQAYDGPPVLDAAEYLDRLGLTEPLRLATPRTAVYQDACHLAHAQQVTAAPRRLLQQVEGLTVVPLADAGMCCGSAGLYNIEQPALAAELGAHKATAIAASGATLAISGNIGCLTQLDAALAVAGHDIPVCHTMELLAGALVGASSTGVGRH